MRQRGFTLIEVLLSVSIIGVLAGASLPLYNSFAVRNDLDIVTQQTAATLRRAQTYARGMSGDSAWSVKVEASVVTLYKGTNFSGRDASFDEVIIFPASASASGLGEVQFAKLSAAPTPDSGTITITSTSNDTRTITLNAKGMVNY